MDKSSKKILLNVNHLRQHLEFSYLQLFEVDNLERPSNFIEHEIAKELTLPADSHFKFVSNRALMHLAREKQGPIMIIKKSELLGGCDYNIVGAFLQSGSRKILLLFYSRLLPQSPVEISELLRGIGTEP